MIMFQLSTYVKLSDRIHYYIADKVHDVRHIVNDMS